VIECSLCVSNSRVHVASESVAGSVKGNEMWL
jgi:hypothetical protein